MKPHFFRLFAAALLMGAAFCTTSCMENSTVVRVRKDGSGEIFVRYHFSPQMAGMMGMMSGLAAGDPSAAKAAPKMPSADSLLKPTQESLEKSASGYGEGVTFVRQEPGKNTAGWDGYLAVYQFADINKLKFDPSNPPGPLGELTKMNPEAAAEAKKNTEGADLVKFSMADGLLTIDTGFSSDTIGKLGEGAGGAGGGPLAGPDGAKIDPAQMMQMAAGMFQGMRLAYFIRVDGEIAETNASYVDGTLITMSDVQLGKMMTDPKFLELVKEGEKFQNQKPTDADLEALKQKIKAIDGAKFETQEKVTIRIK
jgi:hypothetical protein